MPPFLRSSADNAQAATLPPFFVIQSPEQIRETMPHLKIRALTFRLFSLLSISIVPALAHAQRADDLAEYRPIWADSGEVRFFRRASDSTVLVLTARYAPSRSLTDLEAHFDVYALKCGKEQSEIAFAGHGPTEAYATQHVLPLPYHVVHVDPESFEFMLATLGCGELHRRSAR